jgi:hypothetical protein
MNVHFHTADDQHVPPIRRFEHRIAVHPTVRQEVLLAWYRTQSDARSRQEAACLIRVLACPPAPDKMIYGVGCRTCWEALWTCSCCKR